MAEAIIRHDLRGAEILKFCGLCPSLLRQPDERFRPLQIAVVIGSNIGKK
jgi:hypothetical protein